MATNPGFLTDANPGSRATASVATNPGFTPNTNPGSGATTPVATNPGFVAGQPARQAPGRTSARVVRKRSFWAGVPMVTRMPSPENGRVTTPRRSSSR